MKTHQRLLLVLLTLGISALFAGGCANTVKGVSKDYHSTEDHVENIGK